MGKDIITDDFIQLIPYEAQAHRFHDYDFPKGQDKDSDDNNKIYIIIFSIIGVIILGIIIFVCYLKYNKKNRLNNESDIYKENLGEMITNSQL